MTYDISRTLSEGENGIYKPSEKGLTAADGSELLHDISTPHDGARIWKSIMNWVMLHKRV